MNTAGWSSPNAWTEQFTTEHGTELKSLRLIPMSWLDPIFRYPTSSVFLGNVSVSFLPDIRPAMLRKKNWNTCETNKPQPATSLVNLADPSANPIEGTA